ncbi:MAG: hypothetical protein EOP73_14480, partial [Variovorax sp.]
MNTARLQPRLAATVSFSPRLQHAVRLLQMSTLDYAQALRDAALDNPFLDVEMSDGPAGADEAAAPAPASADSGIDVDFEAAHRFDRLPGLDPVASRHLSHDASQDLLQQADGMLEARRETDGGRETGLQSGSVHGGLPRDA